jgi:hypothetical protein
MTSLSASMISRERLGSFYCGQHDVLSSLKIILEEGDDAVQK